MEDSTVIKRAVALKYSGADRAPEIIAAGVGDVARQILKLAEQAGVTITSQDSLGHILSKLDIDNSIPTDSFPVVAEVLAFLYRADAAFVSSKRA
jgi:flagellar biosynthesis protein